MRRFHVGQQAEAQRAPVDELRRVGYPARTAAAPRVDAGAVVTQQHIAESEHQRARRHEPERSRPGAASVRAAISRVVPEPGRQCVSSLKATNLSTRRSRGLCVGVHNKSRACGSLPRARAIRLPSAAGAGRRNCQGHGASAVERITIEVGPLCGVEPELLASAFAILREGGCAAQARCRLNRRRSPSAAWAAGRNRRPNRIGWCVRHAADSGRASSPEMSCVCVGWSCECRSPDRR
jgi:Zn finger protein HypA/HybF involved in hydrogenase expression